jgi:hypothetical protein
VLWEMAEVQLVQLEHAMLVNRGIDIRRHNKNATHILDSLLDDR